MRDLHRIQEQISKEWNNKTPREIVLSIRKEATKSKLN